MPAKRMTPPEINTLQFIDAGVGAGAVGKKTKTKASSTKQRAIPLIADPTLVEKRRYDCGSGAELMRRTIMVRMVQP